MQLTGESVYGQNMKSEFGLRQDDQLAFVGLEVIPQSRHTRRRKDLSVRELSSWARTQLGRISRLTHTDRSGELMLYRQAAKLVEEVGELHAEILGRSRVQREGKVRVFDQESIEGEFADVILATAVLAQILNVDLEAAIARKMIVVDERLEGERSSRIDGAHKVTETGLGI